MSLAIKERADEQRIKLRNNSGRNTSSNSPAGSDRRHVAMRVSPRETSFVIDSGIVW